jgi:hypothetical protein
MTTKTQRRNQLLRRISRIPEDKLKELDDFVSKLEKDANKKSRTLSFAGAWQGIDDSAFADLTSNLVNNRGRNRRRIDE